MAISLPFYDLRSYPTLFTCLYGRRFSNGFFFHFLYHALLLLYFIIPGAEPGGVVSNSWSMAHLLVGRQVLLFDIACSWLKIRDMDSESCTPVVWNSIITPSAVLGSDPLCTG
jgi:hypothetical protein